MERDKKGISLVDCNYSHEDLKKLYIQKMIAIDKKDYEFLDKLFIQCQQLFDKKFLYQMLNKELEITNTQLPKAIHSLLINAISRKPEMR